MESVDQKKKQHVAVVQVAFMLYVPGQIRTLIRDVEKFLALSNKLESEHSHNFVLVLDLI